MDPLVRRVVAGWNFRVAMFGWNPPIPDWVFSRFQSKLGFAPAGDKAIFALAKESINIFLPNLLNLFRKTLGDRYSMNASSRSKEIYYFFAPPQPIDSIALHLAIHGEMSTISLSYMPYKFNGTPDFSKLIELSEVVADPEVVGLHVMNMARKLMSKIRK
jgi:hypothetical protein